MGAWFLGMLLAMLGRRKEDRKEVGGERREMRTGEGRRRGKKS